MEHSQYSNIPLKSAQVNIILLELNFIFECVQIEQIKGVCGKIWTFFLFCQNKVHPILQWLPIQASHKKKITAVIKLLSSFTFPYILLLNENSIYFHHHLSNYFLRITSKLWVSSWFLLLCLSSANFNIMSKSLFSFSRFFTFSDAYFYNMRDKIII